MKKRSIAALLTLNALLLVAIIAVALRPTPTQAQRMGARAGNYLMVAGENRGTSQFDVVYILDVDTGRLLNLYYDSSAERLVVLGGREIGRDIRGDR
jgi:hypothetical protein